MRYGKIAYQWWTFLKLQYILNIFRIIPMHIPSTQKTPKKNTNEDSPFLPKMLWIGNAAAGQQLERWLRVECHWLANLSERPNPTSPNGTWNNPKKTLEKPRKSPKNLLPVIFRVPIFSCNGWWLWWFPPRKNRPPDSASGVFVAGKVNVGWTYCHDAMASHGYNVAKSVKKQKRAGKNSVNDTPQNFTSLKLLPTSPKTCRGTGSSR